MANGIQLKHFSKGEIIITRDQAEKLLVWFFKDVGKSVPPAESLTDDDISFAQALFLEAIDRSYAMGYVHVVFDVFYMKPPTDIEAMLKDFAKQAAKKWFDHAAGKDLSDPKIYSTVKAAILYDTSSVWDIRMQTGELTY